MWARIWIPPLIRITIMLYLLAATMFVFLYFWRDVIIIRIAFGAMLLANVSLAAHYCLKYGGKRNGKRNGQQNQEISGVDERT